ncbi:MAG: ubiquinone biosynthesis protein UbiB, partial [Pelagibacteraceae bacterium TMED232]
MKVCILGNGLTSLALAKALVNRSISTDVILSKIDKKNDKSRTLGISKSNIEFFNKNILNIEKFLWDIEKIEIYSENLNNKKIIDFNNQKKRLFSVIKNHELSTYLTSQLKKNKFFKFKKNLDDYEVIKKKYQLIINCEANNKITKNFFYKKLKK